MHPVVRLSFLPLAVIVDTAACSSNNTPPASGGKLSSCSAGQFVVNGECVTATEPWTQIKPGGSTICLRGAPYSFFVHSGTTNKLLLYFAFGGFCYNAQLCAIGALNCVPTVNVDRNSLANTSGIFDLNRSDNPFKDWSWIFIPECTADFEWGSNTASYPAMSTFPAVTVHHNGFVNVTAVRNWLYENFPSPDAIFVSGSSGGADAALLHYAYIRRHYTNVKNWMFLADSSFGVSTDTFFTDDISSWKAFDNRPMWIPAIANATPKQNTFDFNVIQISKYFQTGSIAEFGTSYDLLESITYQIMGGSISGWHDKMEGNLQEVMAQVPAFRYLVSAGTGHIALDQPSFYEYGVNGTMLRDWVADLANGQEVSSRQCMTDCPVQPVFGDAGAGQ
jgi:hypothetical protein